MKKANLTKQQQNELDALMVVITEEAISVKLD